MGLEVEFSKQRFRDIGVTELQHLFQKGRGCSSGPVRLTITMQRRSIGIRTT